MYIYATCRNRLLGSLLGKAGPKINRVKPRVEMTLEARNRRELLKALIHTGSKAEVRLAVVRDSYSRACHLFLRCLLVLY